MSEFTFEQLREAAERVIQRDGFLKLTQRTLAAELGVPKGSLSYRSPIHFEELIRSFDAGAYVTPRDNGARVPPHVRKMQLVKCAVEVAMEKCYRAVTRADVAMRARVSVSLVNEYLGDQANIADEIMRCAIEHKHAQVLAQGVLLNDVHIMLSMDSEPLTEIAREYLRSL